MPLLRCATALVLVALCSAPAAESPQLGPGTSLGTSLPAVQPVELSYEDFMKWSESERLRRFSRLTPANKAALMRTHAERWLQQHQDGLSARQRRATLAFIDYLTPERFTARHDPRGAAQERELLDGLECALGHARAREVLTFSQRAPRPASSLFEAVDRKVGEWMYWFVECVL